jgi:FAD/FMN-containing dehydrogenase
MEASMDASARSARSREATLSFDSAVARLRVRLQGSVLLPGSDGYEAARHVWNGLVDKRPAAILRCASRDDVVEAVAVGRELGLPLAVRGGGHSISGASVCDGGLVIDL